MGNLFSGCRTDSVNPAAELNSGLEGTRASIEKLHKRSICLSVYFSHSANWFPHLLICLWEGLLASHFPPCTLQIQLLEDSECQLASSSSPNTSIVLEKILWPSSGHVLTLVPLRRYAVRACQVTEWSEVPVMGCLTLFLFQPPEPFLPASLYYNGHLSWLWNCTLSLIISRRGTEFSWNQF